MNNQPTRIPRHEGYRDPSVVVWCRSLQQERHPDRLYREEADKFAATQGMTITDYSLSHTFSLGDQQYQVVSDVHCIDVIKRRTIEREGVRAA